MSERALEVRGLGKRFGETVALERIDLTLDVDEFLVVLGPTGAGKSTLLRVIAGLETPDAGSIFLGGRDIGGCAPAERDVALVFQNFSLYPTKTVRANLAFPLRAPGRGFAAREVDERVGWAAELLHIEHLLDRPARALSGGEMQRVAIGRAIVRRPKLFLMDEPLSNLDAKLREELRAELRELVRELRTPVVWVTHDSIEALSMADRVVVLESGHVLQTGTPEELYARPTSPSVARQLGTPRINVIPVHREDGWWVSEAGARLVRAQSSSAVRALLGIRPEAIRLGTIEPGARDPEASERGAVERGAVEPRASEPRATALEGGPDVAIVELVEDLGADELIRVRWGGVEVGILAARTRAIRRGDRVHPIVESERAIVWPAS